MLYQIAQEFCFLNNHENSQEFDETISALELKGREECLQVGKAIKNNDALLAAIDAEIERLQTRKKTLQARQSRTKLWLMQFVKMFSNSGKIEDECVKLKITTSRGRVNIIDESKIPAEYMRQPAPEPNKELINQALSDGKSVGGCELVKSEGLAVS